VQTHRQRLILDRVRWNLGSMRTTAAILALLLSGCLTPETEEITFRNEGEACLVLSDNQTYPEVDATLSADDDLSITIFYTGCISWSCYEVMNAKCDASVDGNTITVRSSGRLDRFVTGGCNNDCNFMTVSCPLPQLEEGSYTLVHGDHMTALELPGKPRCAGERR
jgi:hypothetical protein